MFAGRPMFIRIDTWSLTEGFGQADRSMLPELFAEQRIDQGKAPMLCSECGAAYGTTTYTTLTSGPVSVIVCTNASCLNN